MIKEVIGDILNPEKFGPDLIAHLCNLECCFGGGLALQIKNKFPEAYKVDCRTKKGDKKKLGTYTCANVIDASRVIIRPSFIVNMYAMKSLGKVGNNVSYDALVDCMTELRDKVEKRTVPLVIGMPAMLGAGLAGGCPIIIRGIIESVWAKSPLTVLLYKLP